MHLQLCKARVFEKRKQAEVQRVFRELSSAVGAETGTSSVQPSARNGSGSSTRSRQSFGSHFLCSSDHFKHSECKEAFHSSSDSHPVFLDCECLLLKCGFL